MKMNLERSKFKELQKVDIGIVIHTFVKLTKIAVFMIIVNI